MLVDSVARCNCGRINLRASILQKKNLGGGEPPDLPTWGLLIHVHHINAKRFEFPPPPKLSPVWTPESVFTLARLKVVPTIKNLYHNQCQGVDQLSSLVWTKFEHPIPDNYWPSRPCVYPGFLPLVFKSAAVFFIIDESSISKVIFHTAMHSKLKFSIHLPQRACFTCQLHSAKDYLASSVHMHREDIIK